jgi:sugar phosphate isomerase/epimerase
MGDLHLPAGHGALPFRAVPAPFAVRGYTGQLISEHHRARYADADGEVCGFLRALTVPRA